MKIQDRMAELSAGIAKIKLDDGTEFDLKPRIEHKRKLLFNYKKITESGLTEELQNQQSEIIEQMVKESYPAFNNHQVEMIMLNYDNELWLELCMYWKWIDRAKFDALKKADANKIAEMAGDEKKNITSDQKPRNNATEDSLNKPSQEEKAKGQGLIP